MNEEDKKIHPDEETIEFDCHDCEFSGTINHVNHTGTHLNFCPVCGSWNGAECDGCHGRIDLNKDVYLNQDDISAKYYWCSECIPEVLEVHNFELKNW